MVIYLSGDVEAQPRLDEMTPREIVNELNKYVVGQHAAKRAVAIALRNRVRRKKLPADMAQDVMPKNIIMIGSTGIGKTEIARRLAKLSNSPFYKVEASKFTEVGYVGRDVESIIRDLLDMGIDLVREEKIKEVEEKARHNAEERLLDLLLPRNRSTEDSPDIGFPTASEQTDHLERTREKFRQQLREGRLNSRMVEIEVQERNNPGHFEIYTPQGIEEMDINLRDMFPNMFGSRPKKKSLNVEEALQYLTEEEQQKLIDLDQVARLAIERVESSGIVFLDEIDKVAGREGGQGPDVSREGVQRDLLPIVEGTTVNTRYGMVKTDHILFIAAGAFHVSKPSDLIPELQGRFPIRVELQPLTIDDFKRILVEPKNSLVSQYKALLGTEEIDLSFTDDAIDAIARFAFSVNEQTEDIGARRLHTIMEHLLDEYSFEGPDLKDKDVVINAEYVTKQLAEIVKNEDLSRYIL
ncbi:MAG: ATP-dependent protease ATPase subunit HslU [Acidobacteriota bacterium]